jgi:hypothetical protein
MIMAGGFLAFLVYRYLGLKFVSRSWFNLDATWAFSLVFWEAVSPKIAWDRDVVFAPHFCPSFWPLKSEGKKLRPIFDAEN